MSHSSHGYALWYLVEWKPCIQTSNSQVPVEYCNNKTSKIKLSSKPPNTSGWVGSIKNLASKHIRLPHE